MACRAYPLGFSGAQVRTLLVRFCGSHQGADGRRCRRPLAPANSRVETGFAPSNSRGGRRGKPRLCGKPIPECWQITRRAKALRGLPSARVEFRDPLDPLCRQVWQRRSGQCGFCRGCNDCSRSTCLPTPFVAFIKRAAKLVDKGGQLLWVHFFTSSFCDGAPLFRMRVHGGPPFFHEHTLLWRLRPSLNNNAH